MDESEDKSELPKLIDKIEKSMIYKKGVDLYFADDVKKVLSDAGFNFSDNNILLDENPIGYISRKNPKKVILKDMNQIGWFYQGLIDKYDLTNVKEYVDDYAKSLQKKKTWKTIGYSSLGVAAVILAALGIKFVPDLLKEKETPLYTSSDISSRVNNAVELRDNIIVVLSGYRGPNFEKDAEFYGNAESDTLITKIKIAEEEFPVIGIVQTGLDTALVSGYVTGTGNLKKNEKEFWEANPKLVLTGTISDGWLVMDDLSVKLDNLDDLGDYSKLLLEKAKDNREITTYVTVKETFAFSGVRNKEGKLFTADVDYLEVR